jgi:hypothetical protein
VTFMSIADTCTSMADVDEVTRRNRSEVEARRSMGNQIDNGLPIARAAVDEANTNDQKRKPAQRRVDAALYTRRYHRRKKPAPA